MQVMHYHDLEVFLHMEAVTGVSILLFKCGRLIVQGVRLLVDIKGNVMT